MAAAGSAANNAAGKTKTRVQLTIFNLKDHIMDELPQEASRMPADATAVADKIFGKTEGDE
jgi:hypothetical protein